METFKPILNVQGYEVSVSKRRGKWGAWKRLHGKSHYLGSADTPVAAHALYVEATTCKLVTCN